MTFLRGDSDAPTSPYELSSLHPDVDEGSVRWSPAEYAKAIYDFSKLESGIGQNFDRLAEFLEPPRTSDRAAKVVSEDDFVTVYQLAQQPSAQTWFNWQPIHSCEEFEQLRSGPNARPTNSVIFMKGYPCPEWLRCLGSRFGIDPEFFRRHFEFQAPSQAMNSFSGVSLPSSSWRMFELNIITIQTAEYTTRRDVRSEQRRSDNIDAMERYVLGLTLGDVATGDPIVRHFSTIDATHFAIEQRVSIYLHIEGRKWTLFLWVDGSKDLSRTSSGPWTAPRSSFGAHRTGTRLHMQPITKYKPMLALKSHRLVEDNHTPSFHRPDAFPKESASKIHIDYGRSLRTNIMACDTVYALKEVFELVTQSELQFLTMCDAKLSEFEDTKPDEESECLPNLKNLKQLLYRHLHQNQEASASLESICQSQWPRASDIHLQRRAEAAIDVLKQDYAQLLKMNEQLYTHCIEAIGVLMNEIVIAESVEARVQAARVGKLTFLAFIFVPLSFTTSFFGMNFREFGAGKQTLSVWAWFVLSVPLLSAAILFFVFDLAQMRRTFWRCVDILVSLLKWK